MDPKQFNKLLKELAEVFYSEETGGVVIKKLKPTIYQCDRCQKHVPDTLCKSRLQFKPFLYWRYHCKACDCYLDPVTRQPIEGPLNLTSARVLSRVRHERKTSRKALTITGLNTMRTDTEGRSCEHEQISESETITRWQKSDDK